ncbi:uncharacterized protein LOC8028426 [Ixodes scapularis]|uniref:uncharacterized protein LOC8028426 n=1 Tax=Ixodes scapularis TaxID=6945 RepID=UPI001C38E27D|nr:uncharacterized protein LOC8028426 [Ixodes scapularis]
MASGTREVKASKARHGSGGPTRERWTAPAVAILKDSVSWQNYRIPKLPKPAPRQSEEHEAGSSAVPRRDCDSPGRHSSGVDDMDPLGASELLGQVLDNMKKAYSMLNCKGSFGFRLQLSPENISTSKSKEVSARPNGKQQAESPGNLPQLCVNCKRKHVSESSAGDTCIRCSLSQVISAEQAAMKGGALMATKRSPPKALETPKHSLRRRTSGDVSAVKLLHKPRSVSLEKGHGSMATNGRSPCKTPCKKRKKGPWILSSSESSDEGSPPKMDSLPHRKTKRRITSDQVHTMELRLHRVDCACKQAKEMVKRARFTRKAQILDFQTTAFLEHFVEEGVASLDLETRGKITALRMKRLFSDGDSASHSSKQECEKGDKNAIKADREPKIGKKNCGLKVTSNIHKELVLATVPCSKASLLPQGASNCRRGEVDTVEVHRKLNISKKDYGSKAASKISKELSLSTVPCSKAFQIPQGASICNKVQRDAMEADRRSKINKNDHGSDAASIIPKKPVLPTFPCSKTFQIPQGVSSCCKGEGDTVEEDHGSKIDKKDNSRKVASKVCKERILAVERLQGASTYRKGRRDSTEASCGPKVGKKDNSFKATSDICEKPVLATVSCSKAFQLPQGATNCCKGEGDAIEEDCGSKVGKKFDRPEMASNICKEHVVVALPLCKVFQLPHKASNYRKGEGFTMEADCRPKISKKNDDPDETSNIRKELVAAVPSSKALHLPQEASINLEGDAIEADCRPKVSKKDHSPQVTSNICKESIPTAVPCGKTVQLQQEASNCCKGEQNAIEANCGLKIIKKDYDHEDYSKDCKELVLTTVSYNETFQLPQGAFNCHKEEGDVMEAVCEPKIFEKNDSSKVIANCFKELVEEECKPELGVASILLGDVAATTREGRENVTQVQGSNVPSILEHSCRSLSEADWQSMKGDCIEETIHGMDRVQEAAKTEKDAEVLATPDVALSLLDNPGALCIALEGLCKDKNVQIKSETLEPLYLDVNTILDSFDAEEQKTKSDGMSSSESNAHQLGDRCLEPSNNDACLLRVEACLAPLPEVGGAHDVRESQAESLQVFTSIFGNSGAVSPPKPRGASVPFEDGLQIKGVSIGSKCTNKESPPQAPEPPKGSGCCPPGYPAKQLFGRYLHFLESFFITLDHCTADVRLRLVEALIPRGLVTLKGILEVMRKICRVLCCDEIGRVNCMELRVFALLDESVSVSSPAGALEEAMDLTVELCGDDPALADNGGCCRSPIHPAVPEPVAERRLQESGIPCRKGGIGEESGAPQNLGIFWSSGMAVPRSPLAQSALPGRVEKEGSVHHGGGSAPCVENTALLNPVSGAVCGANMLSMPAPARKLAPPEPAGPRPSNVICPRAVLARSVATSSSSVAQAESLSSLVIPADQTKSPAFLGSGVVPRLESSSCHRDNAVHHPEGSESVFRSSDLRTHGSLPCRESPTRHAPGPTLSHGSTLHWEGRNLLASSGGKAYDPQARVRPLTDPAKSGALEAALRKGHSPPRYPLLPQPAGNSSVGQPIGVAAERGTTIRTSPHVSSPKDLQSSGKTGSPRHGGCKDGCRVTQVPSPASQRQTERVVVKMASSEERYTNLPRVRVQPRQQHPARMRPTPPSNPGQEERVAHQASSSAASKPLSPSESVASCPDLSPSCPTGAGLGWQDPRMSLWALHQLFMAHNVSQSWTARALGGPPSSAAPPNGGISGVSALPGHDSGNPLETWHLQNLWYRGSLAHHLQTGRATGPVDSVVSQTGPCDVARRRTADHDQSLARQTQQTVARSSMWNVPSGMREDYGRI